MCVAVKAAANDGKDEFEGPFKPAKTLKQGSVLDILKGPGKAVLYFQLNLGFKLMY